MNSRFEPSRVRPAPVPASAVAPAMPAPPVPRRLEIKPIDAPPLDGSPAPKVGGEAPVQAYRLCDEGNATWGYVIIDNLLRGPGMGGTRLAPDITQNEIAGLARAMTLKNAAATLPYGGAKSGIFGDPRAFARYPELKQELFIQFARALNTLPSYIPGPDMGTNEVDMQSIYDEFSRYLGSARHGRGGVGRPSDQGGFPLDRWGITAHGLFTAAVAAEEHLKDFRVRGSKVVIQGLGNVGFGVAEKLAAAGAVIVGASDVNGAISYRYGLDLDALAAARMDARGLVSYAGPLTRRFGPEALDQLLEMPCDILVPAARPNAIHSGNVQRINAQVILQAANNPVTAEAELFLQHTYGTINLVDFIVNAGGIIACAVERRADIDPAFEHRVRSDGANGRHYLEALVSRIVNENVQATFLRQRKRAQGSTTWRSAALEIAHERLSTQSARVESELAWPTR